MDVRQDLERQLKRLKMPGLWHALEMRIAEARESKLGHLEFLSLLVQDELSSREDSMFSKRLKAAGFGVEKTFADFDYRFNEKALPPATVRELATCHFVEQRQNVVIGGPPGIGKTHAVKALGHEACRRGYHVLFRSTQRLLAEVLSDSAEHADRTLRRAIAVDLLILDDFAFRKLDQKEAEMLYVLAEERVGKASTVLTSNRPPEDWYAIFPDAVVGGAVLDRLVSSAIKLISTSGKSYRREVMGNASRPSAKAAAKAQA
jgi:DNA replication protein DnaC